MVKLSVRKGQKKGAFLILLLVVIVAFLPHMQAGVIPWNDAAYHLSRINSLYEALSVGIFPVKVHPTFGGYGYGSGFFYPNVLLYFPALLMYAGMSLEAAYKVFTLVLMLALTLAMYHTCRILFAGRGTALLAALAYLFSNRILYNIYDRYALGETSAAIFLPLAVCGVYRFLVRDKNPAQMMVGITGLLLTHTITTVLAAGACMILVLFQIPRIKRWPEKLLWGGLSAATVLLLCASYLLPMWQQMRAQRLRAAAPWTVSSERVPALTAMIGIQGIGLPVLLLAGMCILLLVRGDDRGADSNRRVPNLGDAVPFFIIGLGSAVLASVQPFFALMNRIGIRLIQFPERLYSISIVFLLLGCAMVLHGVTEDSGTRLAHYAANGVTGLIVTALFVFYALFIFRNTLAAGPEILQQVEGHGYDTLGAGEWLPLETDMTTLTESETAFDAAGNHILGEKSENGRYYSFRTTGESAHYLVPYIYYRGYTAQTEDGTVLEVDKDAASGLLKVILPEGHGQDTTQVTVWYHGTGILTLSYVLSILGMVCFVLTLWLWNKNYRRDETTGIR